MGGAKASNRPLSLLNGRKKTLQDQGSSFIKSLWEGGGRVADKASGREIGKVGNAIRARELGI